MNSKEIRQKFLDFFSTKGGSASGGEEKGHKIVSSSSLIPEETDPSALFTTAGMQQFKPYYLGEKSPDGNKTTSSQKCIRTIDIEEVGDESHLTFFEMLGNFSFQNEYFKKEAIKLAYEFITKEMNLEIDYVTVFEGTLEIPEDEESEKIWKEIDESIEVRKAGVEDNFWGPTGSEGPCGPTTEIYVNDLEVWNIVFNEYYCDTENNYKKLESSGVDTGMGLERLVMVKQDKKNVYETDLFEPILKKIDELAKNNNIKSKRIIADHIKASVFILADGEVPSNLGRGYVLRRLIRRAVVHGRTLGIENNFTEEIAKEVFNIYQDVEWYKKSEEDKVLNELKKEEENFRKTIEKGTREIEKLGNKISGKEAFVLFSTYGYPIELIKEMGKEVDEEEFQKEFEKHQELSRTASAGMFKGGLADSSEQSAKLHTATHLLLAALRQVLGDHVFQKGSNITAERLRFDFSHPEKMTDEQKQEVENIVNEKIRANLEVTCVEMTPEEAKEKGAAGAFGHKYGDRVKVYTINNFSKEICRGPHVSSTGELGEFKIKKESASSAGIRRIKGVII